MLALAGKGALACLAAAAVRLIGEDGLDAVTLRGLGSAAGVSRRAPYRHFARKEDLLAAVAYMTTCGRMRSRARGSSLTSAG